MSHNKPYNKSKCDWAYNASCAADTNCFDDCKMPCPYDKVKSPCDMCDIKSCNKNACKALKIYNERKNK